MPVASASTSARRSPRRSLVDLADGAHRRGAPSTAPRSTPTSSTGTTRAWPRCVEQDPRAADAPTPGLLQRRRRAADRGRRQRGAGHRRGRPPGRAVQRRQGGRGARGEPRRRPGRGPPAASPTSSCSPAAPTAATASRSWPAPARSPRRLARPGRRRRQRRRPDEVGAILAAPPARGLRRQHRAADRRPRPRGRAHRDPRDVPLARHRRQAPEQPRRLPARWSRARRPTSC